MIQSAHWPTWKRAILIIPLFILTLIIVNKGLSFIKGSSSYEAPVKNSHSLYNEIDVKNVIMQHKFKITVHEYYKDGKNFTFLLQITNTDNKPINIGGLSDLLFISDTNKNLFSLEIIKSDFKKIASLQPGENTYAEAKSYLPINFRGNIKYLLVKDNIPLSQEPTYTVIDL